MHPDITQQTIGYLILALVFSRVLGLLAERVGQPPVIGEIAAGVILGKAILGWVDANETVSFLGSLGAILLLFQIGLEMEADDLRRVGSSAFSVAIVGVAGPFLAGYVVSRAFGVASFTAVFLGATLTATSVGITARVLKDLGRLQTSESHVILGAAVVDDILGLVILAVVAGIASGHPSQISVLSTVIYAVAFLSLSLFLAAPLAPRLHFVADLLRKNNSLAFTALVFCFLMSYTAARLGLALIVGSFASGLILAGIEHREHIQRRIAPIASFLVPIFFVTVGLTVDFTLLNPASTQAREVFYLSLALFVVAVLFKLLSGVAVLQRGISRKIVGIGMVPRGEVGIIFATIGLTSHIIGKAEYAAVVAIVVLTTFITPPMLKMAFKNHEASLVAPEEAT